MDRRRCLAATLDTADAKLLALRAGPPLLDAQAWRALRPHGKRAPR